MTTKPATITVVLVPVDHDQPPQVRTITPDLETLQGLVQGDIEVIGAGDVCLIGNEEARLIQSPAMALNVRATLVGHLTGIIPAGSPTFHGPAVIAGGVDDEGEQLGLDPAEAARVVYELTLGDPLQARVRATV